MIRKLFNRLSIWIENTKTAQCRFCGKRDDKGLMFYHRGEWFCCRSEYDTHRLNEEY
jgi:hypothetical protein